MGMSNERESLFQSLSREDWQGLYDHLGAIPYAPGSWSHNWRAALSEALAHRESVEDLFNLAVGGGLLGRPDGAA